MLLLWIRHQVGFNRNVSVQIYEIKGFFFERFCCRRCQVAEETLQRVFYSSTISVLVLATHPRKFRVPINAIIFLSLLCISIFICFNSCLKSRTVLSIAVIKKRIELFVNENNCIHRMSETKLQKYVPLTYVSLH